MLKNLKKVCMEWRKQRVYKEVEKFFHEKTEVLYIFENVFELGTYFPMNVMQNHKDMRYLKFQLDTNLSESFHTFKRETKKYDTIKTIVLEVDLSILIFPKACRFSEFEYNERFIESSDLYKLIAKCVRKGYKVIVHAYVPDITEIHREKAKWFHIFDPDPEKYFRDAKNVDAMLLPRMVILNHMKIWKPYLGIIPEYKFHAMTFAVNDQREKELVSYIKQKNKEEKL